MFIVNQTYFLNISFFQLAKNLSFGAIAAMFGITDRSAKDIFWSLIDSNLEAGLALPDIEVYNEDEMEELYQSMYDSLDPFYQTLYGAFKDPSG